MRTTEIDCLDNGAPHAGEARAFHDFFRSPPRFWHRGDAPAVRLVLAIPALWLATRVLAGRGAALLVAAVVAVAPLPILRSQLVRP